MILEKPVMTTYGSGLSTAYPMRKQQGPGSIPMQGPGPAPTSDQQVMSAYQRRLDNTDQANLSRLSGRNRAGALIGMQRMLSPKKEGY